MSSSRRLYLVILAVLVLAGAAAGFYLRQRAIQTEQAVANCDNPAPPPKPAAPPPKLPGFNVEAGCAPGEKPKAEAPKK